MESEPSYNIAANTLPSLEINFPTAIALKLLVAFITNIIHYYFTASQITLVIPEKWTIYGASFNSIC